MFAVTVILSADMHVLSVGTLDVVTGCGVEHRDAQILIHLLPDRSALNLKHREGTRSAQRVKANADKTTDCGGVSLYGERSEIQLTLSNPPSLCTSR